MTEVLVFLGAGAALFLLLALWSRREDGELEPEGPIGPPDPSVMRRILAQQDMAYIASLRLPRIQRFFVRERSRLALAWLRASRDEGRRLLQRHAEAVRRQRDIRPMTEIRIAWLFASFLLASLTAAGLVRLCGPFRVPALRRSVEHLLGSLDSLGRMAGAPALLDSRS